MAGGTDSKLSANAQTINVCIIAHNDSLSSADLASRLPGNRLNQGGLRFSTTRSDVDDIVVVLNHIPYDAKITAREDGIWRWDLEPYVHRPLVPGFDRHYTHLSFPDNERVLTAPPLLDWWLDKSFDELHQLDVPVKTGHTSLIASTKAHIGGHKKRVAFVERVVDEIDAVDVFGRGRARELTDKWDGLAPYRYSIAIENTSKPDYWTEKISDCFLSYTVPIYYGATNIGDYFPENSFIWLPMDDPDAALNVIRHIQQHDDWDRRVEAVREARRLVLERYSTFGQLSTIISQERDRILQAPRTSRLVHGRRTKPGGWIRGKGLRGNIRARLKRRSIRQAMADSAKRSFT